MFSGLKRFIGYVGVDESETHITIEGLPGYDLARDIQQKWQTTKVNGYLFSHIGKSKIIFPKFFAIDVLYIFRELYADPKTRTAKRLLEKIINELYNKTWLKDISLDEKHTRLNFSRLSRIKLKMLDHQIEFLENYNQVVPSYRLRGLLLAAAPGSGKACRASTKVKVPDGWKRIDMLTVGDDITDVDGKVSKVTGVYPQGKLQLYKVTFADGRTAEVCADHLWNITNRNSKRREWTTVNTKEIMTLLEKRDNHVHIPLAASEDGPDEDLYIDPYLLGILIGDGSFVNQCMLSTPDEFIIEEVKRLIPQSLTLKYSGGYDYRISGDGRNNSLTHELRNLGLFGHRSYEKFIPSSYLNGSHRQRLALLQGLLDTDGTVGKLGCISYCTSSPQLAKDVQKLVWSLGGICKIREKQPFYTYNDERRAGRLSYVLMIRYHKPNELFRLPKKKDRLSDTNQYSTNLRLRIVSIVPSVVDEAVCISVDHPEKLYVIDDYVVTHNTITCIAVSECVEADVFIAVVPKNALERVWEKTFAELINNDPQFWVSKTLGEAAPLGKEYYAFHYEALDRAVEFAKKLKPGTKVCIALDECHNFNEINSARTQLFITLCKLTQSEDIIWSSGTPVKAIGAECVPLLQTIDPFFDNLDAQTRFKKIFGKDAKKANDILRNRIGIVSFKINKKEVVKGEVLFQRVDVKIPNGVNYTLDHIRGEMRAFIDERTKFYNERMGEITDLYNECVKYHEATLKTPQEKEALETYRRYVKMIRSNYDPVMMKAEVIYCNKYELQKIIPSLPDFQRKEFKSARSVVKYVSLKIMGEALGGVLGKRRSQCHVDMVEHVNLDQLIDSATKKSIVFTSYVDVVDKSSDWLEGRGYQPLKIYGDTNKNLANLIKRFEKEEDLNPVVATYQSLSTAVPMTMANNLVMMNAPFRDHEREQAISRCDRLGQDSTVTVYDVFLDTGAAPNISTRSKEILDWSKQQVESIMGIHAPTDLNATLESMVNAGDSFVVSQEAFVSECIRLVKH